MFFKTKWKVVHSSLEHLAGENKLDATETPCWKSFPHFIDSSYTMSLYHEYTNFRNLWQGKNEDGNGFVFRPRNLYIGIDFNVSLASIKRGLEGAILFIIIVIAILT